MAILSGQVIFDGDAANYLNSGDIYGSGLFYGSSFNQNSIKSGFFYGQSINKGVVLQAIFNQNSMNSGYVLYDAIFLDTSTNKGIISGNVLFARTARNDGVVVGDITYTSENYNKIGNCIFVGIEENYSGVQEIPGTGIFCDYSDNYGSLNNAIFFDSSKNCCQVNTALFYDNSCNRKNVNSGFFYNTSKNESTLFTGSFYDSSTNLGVVRCCAIFFNNSVNGGNVCGNALFLNTSSNDSYVRGNAKFAATATNNGTVLGKTGLYIEGAKEWVQTSAFLEIQSYDGYEGNINKVAINNKGDKIVSISNTPSVEVYSLNELGEGLKQWTQIGSDISTSATAVSINASGDRIAFSNMNATVEGQVGAGLVKVYDWNGSQWVQFQQDITWSPSVNMYLGCSISLNAVGNIVAISAPNSNSYTESNNGVVLFRCWSNEFNEWDSLGCIFGAANQKIGTSVKLNASGDKVVFAYPFRAYCRQTANWNQLGSDITLSTPPNGWQIKSGSTKVSMNGNGDKILLSQLHFNLSNTSLTSGVVEAHSWNGTSWTKMGNTLHGEYDDHFGWDIKMNLLGDKIVIGANNSQAGTETIGQGKALIYDWNGSNWIKINYDLESSTVAPANTYLGRQVLITASGNCVYASSQINGTGFISQYKY